MKKRLPLVLIHRLFTAAALLVFFGFLALLAYLYVAFSGALIGDVKTDASMDPLSTLDEKRIQTALSRLQTRQSLPDIPSDLPDPYSLTRGASSGPTPPAPGP